MCQIRCSPYKGTKIANKVCLIQKKKSRKMMKLQQLQSSAQMRSTTWVIAKVQPPSSFMITITYIIGIYTFIFCSFLAYKIREVMKAMGFQDAPHLNTYSHEFWNGHNALSLARSIQHRHIYVVSGNLGNPLQVAFFRNRVSISQIFLVVYNPILTKIPL